MFKISVSYNGDVNIPFLGVKISNPTFAVSKKKSGDKPHPWIFEGQADIIVSFFLQSFICHKKSDLVFIIKIMLIFQSLNYLKSLLWIIIIMDTFLVNKIFNN